ncbi:excisionase family DNA-binding protein [Roseateles asaccharophilus]|uniref:Excisionase family DNA binding protein n=1 Tax=Roseateles asaccharophilus TaxID=582607 RepID=A0ABU2AAZ2_9BURK|nr:excisionase family DNA-binding protein [Roseateles asaccharophilus]MDR7334369.1 excisionase family DNA binding protein [Roseateles asaccharophilus]
MPRTPADIATGADFSTIEVAKLLGLAVRSVQMMVDRGELVAWKTPGGHRRISKESVQAWAARREGTAEAVKPEEAPAPRSGARPSAPRGRVLLIEDSVHYQKLIAMVLAQKFPELELHIAPDGIVGLAMYGQLQPQVLLVDILLPGIDGAALIGTLRSDPHFSGSQLIVITSLDETQREPYAFALEGVAVVHKPRLVAELPALLAEQFTEETVE